MKKIFKIYFGDIKKTFTNYAALIVVIALCILPSLYAWFNIYASWDPYSEEATSGIKIGVVNNDIGTTLKDKDINIGDEVIENLKGNHSLGWQFVSEEEAKAAVEEGKYYATITIPENFSDDLTSIMNDDVKKGEILYTVNEKINAIAPKLTDKGATGVSEQISQAVVTTVSDAIFGVASELGIQIENQIPKISSLYELLLDVQSKFAGINETTDLAYTGATKLETLIQDIQTDIPNIQTMLQNAQGLSGSIGIYLGDSKVAVNKLIPTLKEDLSLITDISNEISGYAEGLIQEIQSGSEKVPEMVDNLLVKVSGVQDIVTSLINVLEKINKLSPARPLDKLIGDLENVNQSLITVVDYLNMIKENVANGVDLDTSLLDKVIAVCGSVSGVSGDLYASFDATIVPKLNEIFDSGERVAQEAVGILQEAENKLPQVTEILNLAYASIGKGMDGLDYVKEMLPKSEEMINELIQKVAKINNQEELNELINLLKVDVSKRSEFLSNPIQITENKIFTMGNYGTAMTPFYSVLSLWVGILLLVSILSVNAHGEYKPVEMYFGKLLLFLTITSVQALIIALGDLYLLKISCVNPGLFIAGTTFTSVVFTFIVYSLVSVFGNVGKVLAIILLVLQVAGSGGTFPIQLTPTFFQNINPFLPFTYAISFAREAIGGVVPSVLQTDMIVLCGYIVGAILIGIVLKGSINKLLTGFVESFKRSGLGEH